MRRLVCVAGVLALTALAVRADACCMVPSGYRGDVDQSWQRAVLVHHDGHEELILRIQPHFHGEPGPPYLEWVVTVPTNPSGYAALDVGGGGPTATPALPPLPGETVPPPRDDQGRADFCDEVVDLHDRLQDLADSQHAARTRFMFGEFSARGEAAVASASLGGPPTGGLDISLPVTVGPFEITAVRARGRSGLDELNAYLAKRGFPEEDPDHMAWFVEREFTFLCIHITPPSGERQVGSKLDLPALRIGFDTDLPYYPAKFSSRQGNFGLRLAVVTSTPLETEHARDLRQRLRAYLGRRRWENLWSVAPPPRAVADAFPEGGPHGRPDRWYVNVFDSMGFNPTVDGKPTIWSWKDDVFFPLGGASDAPGLWYYGDRDPWAAERFAREHGIATGLAIVFVLLAVYVGRKIQVRNDRRRASAREGGGAPEKRASKTRSKRRA